MGIGESLFYQSEFSPRADKELRKVLGPRFDVRLTAELSIIRYSVQALHTGRPSKTLPVSERKKLKALRVKFEHLASFLISLSESRLAPAASSSTAPLIPNTKAAMRLAVHETLCKLGRVGEFLPRVKLPVRRGKLQMLPLRKTPDFYASLASEIGVIVRSLLALEKAPLPEGRPKNLARDHAAVSVAETLKRWNVPVSRTRDGLFAKVLEIVLLEFDHEAPEDMGRFVRLTLDRTKDPSWVRNLVAPGQVSPLLDD